VGCIAKENVEDQWVGELMDEYSIEKRSDRIFDRNTKEYFDEVVSSYREGSHRSAVVMLWSVVVCDLLFKLKYMVDMYTDSTAQSILDEVADIQKHNEKSPEWEFRLVELVAEKTKLLEVADVDHLHHLQKQRHLAAHPVLTQKLELHRPNGDTVRALIRNTLDGILTKPPIYTRKIFDQFINDLAESAPLLIDDEKLRRYLESKYFAHLDTELEKILIRSLWKLVFRLNNDQCDKNRSINYRALELLVRRNESDLIALVQANKDYYSNVANSGEPVKYLVYFLSKYPSVYTELKEDTKIAVRHAISDDVTARCLGWFVKPSIQQHADDLEVWLAGDEHPDLPEDAMSALSKLSDSQEWESLFRRLLNTYYGSSRSYDQADSRFQHAISPYIETYGTEDLLDLLKKIEKNSQTYERRAARYDHGLIKSQCDDVLGDQFDYAQYQNFSTSFD